LDVHGNVELHRVSLRKVLHDRGLVHGWLLVEAVHHGELVLSLIGVSGSKSSHVVALRIVTSYHVGLLHSWHTWHLPTCCSSSVLLQHHLGVKLRLLLLLLISVLVVAAISAHVGLIAWHHAHVVSPHVWLLAGAGLLELKITVSKSASVLVRAVSALFKELTLHSLEIAATALLAIVVTLLHTGTLAVLVVVSWLVVVRLLVATTHVVLLILLVMTLAHVRDVGGLSRLESVLLLLGRDGVIGLPKLCISVSELAALTNEAVSVLLKMAATLSFILIVYISIVIRVSCYRHS
jgi:hypothetical protein